MTTASLWNCWPTRCADRGWTPCPAMTRRWPSRCSQKSSPIWSCLTSTLGRSSGLDVLKILRSRSGVPIIMLTAADAKDDKVRGLKLGADDYLTKPFSHRELIARVNAHLRRGGLQ